MQGKKETMHLLHVIWIRNKPEVVVLIRQLSRDSSNWLNDVSPCVTPWDHVFRALAFFSLCLQWKDMLVHIPNSADRMRE